MRGSQAAITILPIQAVHVQSMAGPFYSSLSSSVRGKSQALPRAVGILLC